MDKVGTLLDDGLREPIDKIFREIGSTRQQGFDGNGGDGTARRAARVLDRGPIDSLRDDVTCRERVG